MNDFNRFVDLDSPTIPTFPNGDTAVRWTLEARELLRPHAYGESYSMQTDIKEDLGVGEEEVEWPDHRLNYTPEEAKLLYTPLPADLPSMKKGLLIQMAAYEGNVDRYARLMRPFMIKTEVLCVVRDIFHHTMSARWWAEQLKTNA